MFKKAVVWGCPLHQHTNSYVYAGFYKAFKAMGFDAYWLNESSDISNMEFSDTLFITEWQHAKNIPKRKDCKYVLHNCDPKDYDGLSCLNIQTYSEFCRDAKCDWHKHSKPSKLNDRGSWYLEENGRRTLFQPWATDLLPNEINLNDADEARNNEVHWVGTIGGGVYGNEIEIKAFRRALDENSIPFIFHGPGSTSFEDNRKLIRHSYMAPAILGTEQVRIGFIVCRVFKNISYGQLGGTNCKASADLFDGLAVYNPDPYALFYDMRALLEDKQRIKDSMKIVRDRHTFVHRIESILEVI